MRGPGAADAAPPAYPALHRRARGVPPGRAPVRRRPSSARTLGVGGGSLVSDEVFARLAELGYLGLKFPTSTVATATPWPTRCWSRSSPGAVWRPGGRDRRPRRDRDCRRSGSSAPRSRSSATWCPGSAARRSRRSAITEPDAGSDVASIRTFARQVDGGYVSTAPRRSSPAASAPTSSSPPSRRPRTAATTGISFLIIERGPGVESSELEKLGWHASDTAHDHVRRRVRARGEPARRGERGLLADHGQLPVGAAADGARRRRRDAGAFEKTLRYALEREAFGNPIGKHQAIRHKLAEIATHDRGGPRRHLRRAAPLRGRRGRRPRGHDRQAGDPASGVRRDGHLPPDPSAAPATSPSTTSSERLGTPGSARSAAGPTRS